MADTDSVADLIAAARQGQETAVDELWKRYFERLARRAGLQLRQAGIGSASAEDIALSVMGSFIDAIQQPDRLETLRDRDDLTRLLFRMTRWKVIDRIRKQRRMPSAGDAELIDHLAETELTPEDVAVARESVKLLFKTLKNLKMQQRTKDNVCRTAEWKLMGLTNREIAARLECNDKSVERYVKTIRGIWRQYLDNLDEGKDGASADSYDADADADAE